MPKVKEGAEEKTKPNKPALDKTPPNKSSSSSKPDSKAPTKPRSLELDPEPAGETKAEETPPPGEKRSSKWRFRSHAKSRFGFRFRTPKPPA